MNASACLRDASRTESPSSLATEPLTDDKPASLVCNFFLEGRCRFGNKCRNLHEQHKQQTDIPPGVVAKDEECARLVVRVVFFFGSSTNVYAEGVVNVTWHISCVF